MNVFIDECGDLGFSLKATRYFVVSFLLLDNEWRISVDFRRLLRRLRESGRYKHDEFKFSKASDDVRKVILEKLCGYDLDFGFVILRKSKVHEHLRDDLNLLYRYVVIDPIMEMALLF